MAIDRSLIDWVEEALAPLGVVSSRPMMGGATLYCDGTIFAIVIEDGLWLKADKHSDEEWDAADCARFTYEMSGRTGSMNYRRAPADVYDDADELRRWAALAVEAGSRAPPRKPRKAKAVSRKDQG